MAIAAGCMDDAGRRLMRRRGETIERSFAHLYDTGGMRRTHLRGHTNILKRVLIHAGGFNLGLVMRQLIGARTPRGLQGRLAAVLATLLMFMSAARRRFAMITASHRLFAAIGGRRTPTDHVRRQLVSNSDFSPRAARPFASSSAPHPSRPRRSGRVISYGPSRTPGASAMTWGGQSGTGWIIGGFSAERRLPTGR